MAIAHHGDLYIPSDSPVHRWAVGSKLLSLLSFMFAVAIVRQLVLVPLALGLVALLYGLSRLPLSYLARRLPYPGLFVVAMVAVLPLTSGKTVLWQWGWLTLRLEGTQTAALVAGRFLAILITGFILLGTTPFLDILKALRGWGLPPLLTDMALLTYRYLYDIAAQLATMQQAMGLRGYGHRRQTARRQWTWLAALMGSLLLRSYERSQRVYKAMRLRGYGQQPPRATVAAATPDPVGAIATPLTLTAATILVLAEIWISRL
ncbi:MAG: cobalt ECF transporter T component CbiQ [Cyanobacteria bacterium]|nr:cobalt ECF transporter T component CbiQ [Cyanobacteriota bacterium]